jgi:hypothetical protein
MRSDSLLTTYFDETILHTIPSEPPRTYLVEASQFLTIGTTPAKISHPSRSLPLFHPFAIWLFRSSLPPTICVDIPTTNHARISVATMTGIRLFFPTQAASIPSPPPAHELYKLRTRTYAFSVRPMAYLKRYPDARQVPYVDNGAKKNSQPTLR